MLYFTALTYNIYVARRRILCAIVLCFLQRHQLRVQERVIAYVLPAKFSVLTCSLLYAGGRGGEMTDLCPESSLDFFSRIDVDIALVMSMWSKHCATYQPLLSFCSCPSVVSNPNSSRSDRTVYLPHLPNQHTSVCQPPDRPHVTSPPRKEKQCHPFDLCPGLVRPASPSTLRPDRWVWPQ